MERGRDSCSTLSATWGTNIEKLLMLNGESRGWASGWASWAQVTEGRRGCCRDKAPGTQAEREQQEGTRSWGREAGSLRAEKMPKRREQSVPSHNLACTFSQLSLGQVGF